MINFFKNFNNQNKRLIEYIFFFLAWSLIWSTIGARLTDLYSFEFSVAKSINWFRALINISFPAIIVLLLLFKLLRNKIDLKSPFLILLAYFLIQSSIFYTDEFQNIITNIFNKDIINQMKWNDQYGLIFSGIGIFLMATTSIIFILIFEKEKKILIQRALITTLIIYLLINFFYSLKLFYEYIKTDEIPLFYYTSELNYGSIILDNVAPRSTGISRSLVILSILSAVILEACCHPRYKKYLYLFIILINILIFSLSSRFGTYSLLLFIFFTIIFFKRSFKDTFFNIFLIIGIPFFLAYYTAEIKVDRYYTKNFTKLGIDKFDEKEIEHQLKVQKKDGTLEYQGLRSLWKRKIENSDIATKTNSQQQQEFRDKNEDHKDPETSEINLSGRDIIWRESLNYFFTSNNKFFGTGSQADRRILYSNKKIYEDFGNHSSNGFIYALLSTGFVGLILLLIFNFVLLNKIYGSIFIKEKYKKPKKYFIDFYFIILFCFLNLRMIFENSYSLFGVDFLIYLTSAFFIINNENKLQLITKE